MIGILNGTGNKNWGKDDKPDKGASGAPKTSAGKVKGIPKGGKAKAPVGKVKGLK